MLGRDPVHSCPAQEGRGLRVRFAPTQCSWAERSERCTARGFLGLSPAQLAGQRLCRGRGWDFVCCKDTGLGTGRVRAEQPHRACSPRRLNLQEGKVNPDPTSCRIKSTTNEEDLQNRQVRLKNPLQDEYPQENTERGTPKGPILNCSQGDKIHWFLGFYSTEASKAR